MRNRPRRSEKKGDKKIGKIRKVEGAAASGVDGLWRGEITLKVHEQADADGQLARILILPDLLIFLFHPLPSRAPRARAASSIGPMAAKGGIRPVRTLSPSSA